MDICPMKTGKKSKSTWFQRTDNKICHLSTIINLPGWKLPTLSSGNLIIHLELTLNEKWRITRRVREIRKYLDTNINLETFPWFFRNWRKMLIKLICKKRMRIKKWFKIKIQNKSLWPFLNTTFKNEIKSISLNHAW